jgi:hypothetical protein
MSYILKGPDDQPILRNDKEVYVQDFTGEIKGVNLEKRTLSIVGTDETRDRDGDIIRVNGWILENYLKNPVFLWAHNYSSVPLGATSSLIRRRNPSRLEFKDIRFPTEGLNPFADMILQLYQQQIINASSVGFLPYKWQDLEKSEDAGDEPPMWRYGREYVKQELLELSGCPVPSNPSALQNAIKNFAGSDILTQNLLNCFDRGIDNLEHKDDILEELRLKNEIDIIDEDRPHQVQVPEKIESEPEVKTDSEEKTETEIEIEPEEKEIETENETKAEPENEKEEILDVESKIPEGEGETKQEFTLSQADKEWLVQTIKEIVQANKEEIPAKAPQEAPIEETPSVNPEMIKFNEEMGRLRKVAKEIEEVVKNATH